MKKFLLFLAMIVVLSGCGGGKEKALDITPEEKEQGFVLLSDYGIKYKTPESFKKYAKHISPYEISGEEGSALVKKVVVEFISQEIIDVYFEIDGDKALSEEEKFRKLNEEVWNKTKPLFAFSLIKKEGFDSNKAKELTGFEINEEVGSHGDYLQYFSTNNPDEKDLSPKSSAAYSVLLSDIKRIPETITTGAPQTTEASLDEIKNLQFNTQDLNGEPIDQEIFKNSKLTMVNVWATWCGPCKAELPELAKVSEKYKNKGVQILGILSDSTLKEEGQSKDSLTDEDKSTPEVAKTLLADSGAGYLNIKVSPNINARIMPHVTALPTTFFVDSNGDVIGEILVGAKNEEEFSKSIDKTLELLNN